MRLVTTGRQRAGDGASGMALQSALKREDGPLLQISSTRESNLQGSGVLVHRKRWGSAQMRGTGLCV